jgi:hypothetical protein
MQNARPGLGHRLTGTGTAMISMLFSGVRYSCDTFASDSDLCRA